jgi:hypothetical protein
MPPAFSGPRRQVLWIIGGFVLVRLIASAFMGLGMDESYSTAISRDLHLSYFDHPPLHQWIAHLGAEVFGYGRWTRLPFIALFAGSSWLMFRLTARLFGEAAGVWACLALNLSAFFTLAAGEWVLPDGPLIFCELAAALCLARVVFPAAGEAERPWLWWPAAGLWLGLAALSKYQAATVGLGLGLFLLTTRRGRRHLATPWPYLAGALVLVTASPVLVWNAQHAWISFTFQGARGAPRHLTPMGPFIGLLGQAALLSPWVAVPLVWAGWRAVRAGPAQDRAWLCLLMAGAPTIVLFTLLPLFGSKILPHWPMPGWLMLFPVLGDALARSRQAWPARWAAISAGLLLVFWVLAVSDAATAWVRDAFPRLFPKTDPTYEAVDWSRLRAQLDRAGLLRRPGQFVVAAEWNEAGKIDQAVGDIDPVLVFSPDPREYAFRPDSALFIGHDALIIGRGPTVAQELSKIAPHFASLTPLGGFSVGRGDKREIELTVIQAHDLLTPYPSPPWVRGRR